jgi:hypothetical protein
MLFNNYNIDKIPVIKGICKDILEGFMINRNSFNMRDECNLLTDYIRVVMESKSKIEKEDAMKSMSNIYEDAYYRKLMERMGDYYDISDPLLVICDNITKYHFRELLIYGWDDHMDGVWTREKMLEDREDLYNIHITTSPPFLLSSL